MRETKGGGGVLMYICTSRKPVLSLFLFAIASWMGDVRGVGVCVDDRLCLVVIHFACSVRRWSVSHSSPTRNPSAPRYQSSSLNAISRKSHLLCPNSPPSPIASSPGHLEPSVPASVAPPHPALSLTNSHQSPSTSPVSRPSCSGPGSAPASSTAPP